MKKHLLPLLLTTLALAALLTACGVKITAISLPQDVVLAKGETLQLTPDYTPHATAEQAKIDEAAAKLTVTWTSSDETVVTVGETGLVTAVAAGEADVTAAAGDGLSAVTHVKVVVPPTGVEAPETLTLVTNGESTQALHAKMLPADATEVKLTYTSSDETVATVDADGTVTAVGNGECTITTYLTADLPAATGETADAAFGVVPDGMSAATRVTVTTDAESVTLDRAEGLLYVGGTVQLTATVAPETATDAVAWTVSDESVATVDENGAVTAKAPGSCTVTAATGQAKADYALTVQNKPVATPRPTAAPVATTPAAAAPAPEQPAAPAPTPEPVQEQPAQSGGDYTPDYSGDSGFDPVYGAWSVGSGIDWTQDPSNGSEENSYCAMYCD